MYTPQEVMIYGTLGAGCVFAFALAFGFGLDLYDWWRR